MNEQIVPYISDRVSVVRLVTASCVVRLPSSGTDCDEGGVDSARMRSSRKNATKMFMPANM